MLYSEYTWIFATSVVVAFVAAFGIGANDVSNSFASAVGAKAVSMPQAILIAALCEFGGAVLLGANVTDTIKGGIVRLATFDGTPDIFLFGFFCVMVAAAFWDNLACHLALPVSTTHTTVGATIGMALASRGGAGVLWWAQSPDFPYLVGVGPIFLSWLVLPAAAGLLVAALFFPLRLLVLRSPHAFVRALAVFPATVFVTIFVAAVFVVQTGQDNAMWPDASVGATLGIPAAIAGAAAALAAALAVGVLRPRILAADKRRERVLALAAAEAGAGAPPGGPGTPGPPALIRASNARLAAALADVDAAADNGSRSAFGVRAAAAWHDFCATRFGAWLTNNWLVQAVMYGATYDVHDHLQTDSRVAELWADAEVFDVKTERLFRYLQVFTAASLSFAHGSNDVSNAMGPFVAVYQTWLTGETPPARAPAPAWVLALGGAGIVCGLTVFGYKVMAVLAVKSVKLTNARGFCVELATAITVVVASRFGIPVSTTEVVVGAVVVMGMMEGRRGRGVQWRMVVRILGGWAATLVVACGVAAGLTAFGLYTPNKGASLRAAAAGAGR